ncbi:MAG TPA: phosphatase domain-containing protein [Burkholderiaceae bacterium]|nr:phosphatase domain-containing protein [Burkholderiaceae bacterium]
MFSRRNDPVVLTHVGHVIDRTLMFGGRVVRKGPLLPADESDTRWRNLRRMARLFVASKVRGARVRAHFAGAQCEAVTDDQGYFDVELELPEAPGGPLWQHAEVELVGPAPLERYRVRARAQVMVHPLNAQYAVISDIDDTVVATNVTNKLKMLATVLLSNAHTRLPFKGVAAFYRALEDGRGGEHNPIFYVSNGPWNLHDVLVEFFELNRIPLGPIYLRDFGVHLVLSPGPPGSNKIDRIEHLMRVFPPVPVILIGDSGEHDPEIYARIAESYPQRVRAIYIRCVHSAASRRAELEALVSKVGALGIDFVLAGDSEQAARHAAARGFIRPEALQDIHAEKQKDES